MPELAVITPPKLHHGMGHDHLTHEDAQALRDGFAFSTASLFRDLCAIDLPSLGYDFAVPMFCFMGTHDQQTPIVVAEAYFQSIAAPLKAFVRFEGCHHFAHMDGRAGARSWDRKLMG